MAISGRWATAALVLVAIIWGLTFVAQRAAMQHMQPLAFNALRMLLGGACLLPLVPLLGRPGPARGAVLGGLALGLVMCAGSSLQQMGLVEVGAGKAGFITGLYMVMVPLFSTVLGERQGWHSWLAAAVAMVGLYLLSWQGDLGMAWHDGLIAASAVFWAVHLMLIDHLARRHCAVRLAAWQLLVCGALGLASALVVEGGDFGGARAALWPLFYSGVLSCALAFSLQILAQRHVRPAPAAVILATETVFAALGGWLILSEMFSPRQILGAALMFAGMILAQRKAMRAEQSRNNPAGD